MGFGADARAWLMQKSAPLTVRYGRSLVLSGTELGRPRSLRVPTRHGPVRCLAYEPDTWSATYVHLHGGAFVMRHPRMDDFFCRLVAAEVGMRVLAVDYDVAPQVRYPVAHEQTYDVLASVAEEGPVAIGGFSAGGNLAASAALRARDIGRVEPFLQLLGVPALDIAEEVKRPVVGVHPMITPQLLRLVRETYFRDPLARRESYASPLLARDLSASAPAMVITAERDLLRTEGDQYASRLRAAGVAVDHLVVPGVDHYFLTSREQARPILDRICRGLNEAYSDIYDH